MAKRKGYDGVIDPDKDLVQSVLKDGSIYYQKSNGVFHREKAPAKISPDGVLEYYYNGVRHRDDGPAICYIGKAEDYPNFRTEYWLNGFQYSLENYVKQGGKIPTQETPPSKMKP